MIEVKEVEGPLMFVEFAGELSDADFDPLVAQIDNQIALFGKIRLLVDARNLEGWANVSASQTSVEFLRQRHARVDKLAVIVGEPWQHWATTMADILIGGDLKTFDVGQAEAARAWLADDLEARRSRGGENARE